MAVNGAPDRIKLHISLLPFGGEAYGCPYRLKEKLFYGYRELEPGRGLPQPGREGMWWR